MGIRERIRIRTRLRSAITRIWPPTPKPLILMYHRIAEPAADPWGLAVSSAHFEQHLSVLRRTRHPFSLAKFIDHLTSGTLPSNAVALTFDDGYLDNLAVGKPLLAAADVPATIFLATGFLDRREAFWWDELAALIMLAKAPKILELAVGKRPIRFEFSSNVISGGDSTMSAEPARERAVLLSTIWEALQQFDDDERRIVMAELRSFFTLSADQQAKLGRPMTRDEVRLIAADQLMTIGAHTVTHPLLSSLPVATCRREIVDSKLVCEDLAGSAVTSFAYPYGDFNLASRDAVEIAGFTIAVSICQSAATMRSDLFAMPRVHVRDWNGDAFEQALHLTQVAH